MTGEQISSLSIPLEGVLLKGELMIPPASHSMVLFVHGSGSSRLSPRNKFVAEEINKAGIGTLLFDLLTDEEDEVYETRFNIGLLTERLLSVTRWIKNELDTPVNLGYFGASTGAAAALCAAAKLGKDVKAVVSRGGRPDMAVDDLLRVGSPTLLIVGGDDEEVIELNRRAFDALDCVKELKIIPGATHLFEEPGTLEQVAQLAALWFMKYLKP
ncbi:MAG: alpha/beta hydrolase [Patescibacteria group bacterium]